MKMQQTPFLTMQCWYNVSHSKAYTWSVAWLWWRWVRRWKVSNIAKLGINLSNDNEPLPSDYPHQPKKPSIQHHVINCMSPVREAYLNSDKNTRGNGQGMQCCFWCPFSSPHTPLLYGSRGRRSQCMYGNKTHSWCRQITVSAKSSGMWWWVDKKVLILNVLKISKKKKRKLYIEITAIKCK